MQGRTGQEKAKKKESSRFPFSLCSHIVRIPPPAQQAAV
uniref:Uncharacterized protein n=1 Tax=Faecalibaculum rodentium TaxID=1702221 RepID=A0A140DSJ0_9FIRM|nr:hypothetical protein AALO17_04830 [Faecalibaculum rodentium]